MQENTPELWLTSLPKPPENDHKYDRGNALILGAPELTGATRLAAEACARIGAGLVSVISKEKRDVFRAALPAHILVRDKAPADQTKVTAYLLGPGGVPKRYDIRREDGAALVLDAEGIFELSAKAAANTVITPHEGEFAKAFPGIQGGREDRALSAAAESGATVVLKGPETVIATPEGQLAVNHHATPYLATAGTGDVLSGLITGLLAQGMPVFEAVCAAVWIHGEAGRRIGPGLVASDLPGQIPAILSDLLQ